jgi:hypothetical protein
MSSIKLRCLDNSGNNIFIVDSDSGILSTNTISSSNSSTGAFSLSGGISINKTSNASSITAGGALTIAGGASIAKDVHIGGNLTVYGTQTQIISQVVRIQDNLLVVNAVPNTGRDGGILFQRYQLENDTGLGDVVTDTNAVSTTLTTATSTTLTFSLAANTSDNYYNGCFIKITSGAGANQVRQITSYVGAMRTATLNTSLTTTPIANDTVNIYNRIYAAYYYSETSDNFVLGWTTNDPDSSSVTVSDYIGLKSGYIMINDTTNAIGIGSGGSLTTLGGASISKGLYVGENVTIGNNLSVTMASATNITTTNTTSQNSILTNVSSSNITSTNNIFTNISSSNCTITNVSSSTITTVNITSGQSVSTNITTSTINITTGLTSGTARITNSNLTNVTISSLSVSKLDANGNTNTVGNIFTTGGNVGINIISPAYHLDVNGNVHVNANLYVDGLISGGTQTGSTFAYLTLTSTDDAINLSTGSLLTYGGITIQSPTDAESVTNGGSFLTEGGASIGQRLFVGTGLVSANNSNTVGNIFTTGGNVGIGTASPNNNLEVYSENTTILRITGAVAGQQGITLWDTAARWSIYKDTNTTSLRFWDGTADRITFKNGGNVGIGTTDPTSQLHILNSVNTESGMIVKNSNSGSSAYSSVRIGNDSGSATAILFLNSSTRSGDGGTNTLTIRNDLGPIRLQGGGSLNTLWLSTSGNIGIGTTSPGYGLHIEGSSYIVSSNRISNGNPSGVSGGSLNVNGDMVLSGTSGIYFTTSGRNAPTTTNRSFGSKIVLYPTLSGSDVDYAMGVDTNCLWSSVQNSTAEFKWYQGTTIAMSIVGNATVTMHSTENVIGTTGGSLVVNGGTLIKKDTTINGSLYVDGQNLSSILGNTTIGNFSGTGVCTISGISIGKTMANTNYKITGCLRTTTDNLNVYTVSFKKLTTTTFDAVIYRIDSLGSGWSDSNLYLSWQITP